MAVTASVAASMSRPVIRTCIGCRQRAAATELLRVVVRSTAEPGSSPTEMTDGRPVSVVPDPRHRASGRGAWLHPVLECMDLAERRRAFGRALRVATPVDTATVREYVESLIGR